MLRTIKILLLIIMAIPVIVQAGYNGYIASRCADYYLPGMTYNKIITQICTPEWQKITEEVKLSFPKNY